MITAGAAAPIEQIASIVEVDGIRHKLKSQRGQPEQCPEVVTQEPPDVAESPSEPAEQEHSNVSEVAIDQLGLHHVNQPAGEIGFCPSDSQRLRPPPRNPPPDIRGVERW